MYSFLFKNRLGAAAFVLLTVAGAASLVGTEENGGLIQKTAQEIEAQKSDFEEKIESMDSVRQNHHNQGAAAELSAGDAQVAFTPQDDLIDTAEGFDPTPKDEFNPEAIAEPSEVVIILNNEPITE